MHIVLFYETFQEKLWAKYKSDKKISINYAEKQGKKDSSVKDDTLYFSSQDPKVLSSKLKNSNIEIPSKYYDIFKKLNPNADVAMPSSNIRSKYVVATFIVRTLN